MLPGSSKRRSAVLAGAIWIVFLATVMSLNAAEPDASFASDLAAIAQAGPNGAGSAEARAARDRLSQRDAAVLPALLAAMDTPNVVAANWYRTVFDEITARELASGEPTLPRAELEACVRDAARQGRVRRLALDVLDRVEPEFGKQLIPTLLDDPEFRADAVTLVIAEGDAAQSKGEKELAATAFRRAFEHARDSSQVTQAADRLSGVGQSVNVAEHLGLVTDWYVVGPFDAPGMSGFATAFPPEEQVDLGATYKGQAGREIGWKRYQTADRLGLVDLVQAIAPAKEAVGYAYAELESPADIECELRCGADDNLAVWVNGERVFGREQWLNGIRLDRFITPVTLKAGTNRVLAKVCQGPQHKNPAVGNAWSMQLRFCDKNGGSLDLRNALPAPETDDKSKTSLAP